MSDLLVIAIFIFYVGLLIYVVGAVLFTLYASVFNKGWGDSYRVGKSLAYGLSWPIAMFRIARKRF